MENPALHTIQSPSKRTRIETLVTNSIEETALSGNHSPAFAQSVRDAITRFVEESPAEYFNVADDRKIAGQVLAYMMEVAEIGYHEVNAGGYRLVKLIAEADQQGFRKSTPTTFAKLQRSSIVAPEPTDPKRV